ncbi:hypothetical protein F4774DRAFT_183537 [Daldinia eschscholtzii]|nr:hypothetical protein F4774DRAFT_183537 [Daldinia eschscholtzii]
MSIFWSPSFPTTGFFSVFSATSAERPSVEAIVADVHRGNQRRKLRRLVDWDILRRNLRRVMSRAQEGTTCFSNIPTYLTTLPSDKVQGSPRYIATAVYNIPHGLMPQAPGSSLVVSIWARWAEGFHKTEIRC